MKQREIILKYLESYYPEWVPGYSLHGLNTSWGFLGSRAERNCREMRSEGILERKIIKTFAHYRIKKEGQGRLL